MQKPILIVLAAGMGSRYGGLKQLDGIGPNGETIMDYSVYDAAQAGFGKVIFIVREHFLEEFRQIFSRRYDYIEVDFAVQELSYALPVGYSLWEERVKPWGTAHAMLMAASKVSVPFAVINADDFYGRSSYQVLGDFLRSNFNTTGKYCMVGFPIANTLSESGTVSRGICTVTQENELSTVTERHQVQALVDGRIVYDSGNGTIEQADPHALVSMNMWGFTPDIFEYTRELFHQFIREKGEELKSEFYIPFVVNHFIQNKTVSTKVLSTTDAWFGITFKEDRPQVEARIEQLMASGAYPQCIINVSLPPK